MPHELQSITSGGWILGARCNKVFGIWKRLRFELISRRGGMVVALCAAANKNALKRDMVELR